MIGNDVFYNAHINDMKSALSSPVVIPNGSAMTLMNIFPKLCIKLDIHHIKNKNLNNNAILTDFCHITLDRVFNNYISLKVSSYDKEWVVLTPIHIQKG